MAFGLLKRNASATSGGSVKSFLPPNKTHQQHPQSIRCLDVLGEPHLDATECTTDREDDDGSRGSGLIEESTGDPRVVELQHDLRAKTAQVSVLRDTLTNLSGQFREQTTMLEQSQITIVEKDAAITTLALSLEQVNAQYQQSKLLNVALEQEWKVKYNDLERILERAVEEKDQWKIRFEELRYDQEDALLGKKQMAQPQSHSLWSDDDEENVAGAAARGAINSSQNSNMMTTMIGDDYEEDSFLDEPANPTAAVDAAMDVAMRPPAFTNRTGPFRRKKQRPAVKPFQIKPMEWVLTSTSNSDDKCADHPTSRTQEPSVQRTATHNSIEPADGEDDSIDDDDIYMSKQSLVVDDAFSRDVSQPDAKARARRVRYAAKKEAAQAGFNIQKLEC